MRKKVRKSLAFLLALALVVSVMSGLGLSVSADEAQPQTEPAQTEEVQDEAVKETPKVEESTPKEGEEEEEADPDAEAVPEEKKDVKKAEGEGSGDSSTADPVEPADEPSADENGTDVTTLTEEQQAQYKAVYDQIMACTDADELAKLLEQYGEDELFGIYMEQYLTDEQKAAWDAKINAPETLAITNVKITDTIQTNGLLTAEVTPTDVTGLIYTWYKSDSQNGTYTEVKRTKVTGSSYNITEDGKSLNVALDGGAQKYYKVSVTDATDKTVTSDSIHIDYYTELRNGGFENPNVTEGMQVFVKEGTNGLVWRTTAEATTVNDQGKAKWIEFVKPANNNNASYAWHGVTEDYIPDRTEGTQCAEINAEADGALYQDVLTIPGSTMYWQLSHLGRTMNEKKPVATFPNRATTSQDMTDTMYVLIMPYDEAQGITTQAKVLEIINAKKTNSNAYPNASVEPITYTWRWVKSKNNYTMQHKVNGVYTDTYSHTAQTQNGDTTISNISVKADPWEVHKGTYTVPAGKYLTRYFFVAGDTATGSSTNYTVGNHIDKVHFSTTMPDPDPDKGNLTVTKTVKGLDNLPDDYQVEVTATAGSSTLTGTISNFTKDSDGNWTGTCGFWGIAPGSYTVTESPSDVEGYTYTADPVSGTGTANVTDGKTATVSFTNTYTKATADLTIKKKIMVDDEEYKDADFNNTSYTFTVSGDELSSNETYEVGGVDTKVNENGMLTATVNGASSVTISNLPLGEYTITESEKGTDPEWYQSVKPENNSETVKLTASNAEKTITNYYKKVGKLTIKKTVSGLDTSVTNDNKYQFTVTGPNGYSVTVKITGAGETTLTGLELGNYTVEETGTGYTIDGYTWEGLPNKVTAEVKHKNTATATINNVYHKNPKVTIKKQVDGNMSQASDTFDFTTNLNSDSEKNFSLSANATNGKVIEIPYGGGFMVTEESNSMGYTLKTITVGGKEVTIANNGYTLSNVKEDTTVIFTNKKQINPPNGIITTIAPYAIMVVLAAGAGVYFVYSRRRHNG